MRSMLAKLALFIAVFATSACAPTITPRAATTNGHIIAERTIMLPASRGRQVEMRIWSVDRPTAIIVFSAGGNGQPGAYSRMMRALAGSGFTVIAPVHADALARGNLSGSGGVDSFMARIEDLAIARGHARTLRPELPLVVMGHSFGSMMSSIAVGAMTPAGPQRDPDVDAFVAFSSPGLLRGVVTPASYNSLATPLLVVTGDNDLVPSFVQNWRDHRVMFDNSMVSGSALVVVEGGGHEQIIAADDQRLAALAALTASFIRAATGDNAAARADFAQATLSGATIERH